MGTKERRYHHGDLRRALLDAALAIVDESGIAAVTMSAVARRAGVSSGAPYRHFKDSAALMQALWHRAHEEANARMQAAAGQADSPLEGFRQSGIAYVRFAVEEPALFRVLAQGEYAVESEDSANAAFTAGLRGLLTSGDRTAPLDPHEPLLVQLAARCLMHGLAQFFIDGQLERLGIDAAQAERLADALTQAMGGPSMELAPDANSPPIEPK